MASTTNGRLVRPLLSGALTAVAVFFLVLFIMGQFGGDAGPGEVALVAVIAVAAGLAVWYLTRRSATRIVAGR
jgi:4-amino-4-deoxy-L-arabinose transferase-like glycosyltransferase